MPSQEVGSRPGEQEFRDWFLRGVPRVVGQAELTMRWSGNADGRWFRCHLCSRYFEAGDTIRSVYSNYPGSPFPGNPFICDSACGAGTNEEVLAELGRRKNAIPWWACPWGIEPKGRPTPEATR